MGGCAVRPACQLPHRDNCWAVRAAPPRPALRRRSPALARGLRCGQGRDEPGSQSHWRESVWHVFNAGNGTRVSPRYTSHKVAKVETSMRFLKALICCAAAAFAAPAAADVVKIVVPFAAGGPVDQLARVLAHELGPRLPPPAAASVEEKGGPGGPIGSETVARAAPDGKTVLLASLGSQVISPVLRAPSGYDPVQSFEPGTLVGAVPPVFVLRP